MPGLVPVPAPAPFAIAIAGVGGAGCHMVQRHQQSVVASAQMQHLAINTDRNTIARIQAMPAILLHADASGIEAVMPLLVDCKALYLLVGLGGRTGSAATAALAIAARDAGLHTVALVSMPFEWEGCRRRATAELALKSVRECAAETVVVDGDAVAERLGEEATLDQLMQEFDAALLRELDARLAARMSS